MAKYDRVLIVGDFNIHVCCPSKPLSKDFLNIIDSFNLVQSVSGHTQILGHTLDLVLWYGLPVKNVKVHDALFSDHMPVLFEIPSYGHTAKPCAPARRRRIINSTVTTRFSAAFKNAAEAQTPVGSDTEHLTSSFYSTCINILDCVAPFKTLRPKAKKEPWLTDISRSIRRECRRAERKWKKDKLQVSFDILKETWLKYQKTVKSEKTKYFSDIVLRNRGKPHILFNTINTALNKKQPVELDTSSVSSEQCLQYFVSKISNIRAQITPPSFDPSVSVTCPVSFSHFEPISFANLSKTIGQMKMSSGPTDIVPPLLITQTIETTGPNILGIMNCSLASGVVPKYFNHAVVQPLIKKPNLDSSSLSNYSTISKLPFLSKVYHGTSAIWF